MDDGPSSSSRSTSRPDRENDGGAIVVAAPVPHENRRNFVRSDGDFQSGRRVQACGRPTIALPSSGAFAVRRARLFCGRLLYRCDAAGRSLTERARESEWSGGEEQNPHRTLRRGASQSLRIGSVSSVLSGGPCVGLWGFVAAGREGSFFFFSGGGCRVCGRVICRPISARTRAGFKAMLARVVT